MTLDIVIYLIGYVAAYWIMRNDHMRHCKKHSLPRTWNDVYKCALFGFGSWLFFIIGLFYFLDEYTIKSDRKPPRWL